MAKAIGKGALILLAGVMIGVALLWISYLLPVTEESVHVAESTLLLEQEGWYPTVPLMHQYQNNDVPSGINPGGILDNFTDSIMITTAGHRPDDGALHQAMNMAGSEMVNGYSYYWHGYVVLLRPLLLFLNYADMRVLNQLLQFLAVTALACMLYRRKGAPWAALALTVYGLLLPMAVSQALQYSWVFYIGMAGSLTVVRLHDWLAEKQRIYFLFLILGMLTCYMDLLTYPLFTWGIPMIWWFIMGNDEEPAKSQLVSVILCGVAWICGYGGLWMGKWLIGGIILQRPIWEQAWHEVQYRAGTLSGSDGYDVSHLKVLLRNLVVYKSIQDVFPLGCWIVWWGCRVVRRSRALYAGNTPALLLIALSPVAWYIVLHNHTYVHSSFTYRIWVVTLTALLASMISSLDGKRIPPCNKRGSVIPFVLILTAVVIALHIKEEAYIHNGNFVPTLLELGDRMELRQELTPSYQSLSAINLLLYAETGQPGEIAIYILNENQVLQEFAVSASEVEGGKFYELPVNLRLKRDATYQISISGKNLDEGHISVGVTDLGLHPLAELSPLRLDGQDYDAQLICGFRYRHRVGLRKLALAVELQLLLYWSVYLSWKRLLQRKKKI